MSVEAAPPPAERTEEILSDDALAFVAELHGRFGQRKAENLRATGAEAIAAANPGCSIQIAAYLDTPIFHPMTLLDHSLRGSRP